MVHDKIEINPHETSDHCPGKNDIRGMRGQKQTLKRQCRYQGTIF